MFGGGTEVAGPEMDKEDGKRKAHLKIAYAPELPADACQPISRSELLADACQPIRTVLVGDVDEGVGERQLHCKGFVVEGEEGVLDLRRKRVSHEERP